MEKFNFKKLLPDDALLVIVREILKNSVETIFGTTWRETPKAIIGNIFSFFGITSKKTVKTK